MIQRVCSNCKRSKERNGRLICIVEGKTVKPYELCPAHTFKRKDALK